MAVTVNAAIIDEKDTVVVAIEKINAGDEVIWRDRNGDVQKIKAITDVPMYHKVAIKEMPKGTDTFLIMLNTLGTAIFGSAV